MARVSALAMGVLGFFKNMVSFNFRNAASSAVAAKCTAWDDCVLLLGEVSGHKVLEPPRTLELLLQ